MSKVALKTALKAICIVLVAIFMAFGVASLSFPGSMATLFEKMGAYSFATGYAGLAYNYQKTTKNLSRCLNDSILARDDDSIINYGEKLLARSDFDEFAAAGYKMYVTGNIARSKYNKGNKEGALTMAQSAMEGVEGFPVNNALAVLAIRATEKKDADFKERLYLIIIEIEPTAEQQEYYDLVVAILT